MQIQRHAAISFPAIAVDCDLQYHYTPSTAIVKPFLKKISVDGDFFLAKPEKM